jgi:hypothetical protein
VVEAMASGAMRPGDPDLVAMYLWSVAHGLLTLSMSCRLDECPEFSKGAMTDGPVELFRAFRDLVRTGLAGSGDTDGAGPGGGVQ